MDPNISTLMIPAFIAGLFTFLAPCTLPFVPGYLSFIGGVSADDLKNPEKTKSAHRKIFTNGLLFMVGFSLMLILFGAVAGSAGSLLARYQLPLARIGAIFVIFFGLLMLNVLKIPFLEKTARLRLPSCIGIGKSTSSFILGASFAVGWTPCIGPVLGSILLIAATSATPWSGAMLLAVFSLGLAVPFLLIALGVGSAARYISKASPYTRAVSIIGGIFLVGLGILLLIGKTGLLITYGFKLLKFINYNAILRYL